MGDTTAEQMDPGMTAKIDGVLAAVRDEVTLQPVSTLGLVTRVRYNSEHSTLVVFTTIDDPKTPCVACNFTTAAVFHPLRIRLREAFEQTFPDLTIVVQ